ncbi:MAG: UPF0175 family protein [Fimbriimonadales bacterium]|nr:UPF0175 family protein [Fimbriimonadales bacterium]
MARSVSQQITLSLELPEGVLLSAEQAKEILVLKLLEDGVLSQSEAAQALEISRSELLERMHKAQIPVVAYTQEDLKYERLTLQWLQEQRKLAMHSEE